MERKTDSLTPATSEPSATAPVRVQPDGSAAARIAEWVSCGDGRKFERRLNGMLRISDTMKNWFADGYTIEEMWEIAKQP